jgi:N-hydroxyarylamine O-acetyltransferase
MDRTEITARYLEALGLERRRPEADFLDEIVRRHVARFPFASVGPQLGDALPLEPQALFDRIVARARGGYCFEQNGLQFEVLEELGFDVTLCLARVIYNRDIHPGLTHRITLVSFGDRVQVADVGFGPLGPAASVPLSGVPVTQGWRQFRVGQPRPGEFHMQTFKDGDWYSLYRFERVRYGQADCVLGHFFSHRHPDATFVNNLVVSRILDEEIRHLRNREFTVTRSDGQVATEPLRDAAHLQALLTEDFGLRILPEEGRVLFGRLP